MPDQITAARVEALETALIAAKKSGSAAKRQQATEELAEIRMRFRLQEQEAGRRVGLVAVDNDTSAPKATKSKAGD
jgi:signal transduction histidine kinase